MIAKGTPHGDGRYLARYLARDSKGNERAELGELRGFAVDNIFDAFALGQLQAQGTRCENPFFHVQVRTPKHEELTRGQWQKIADRLEQRLGFDDQPRAIVFHMKDGHEHMHVAWLRIDAETNRALDPGLYKNKLKQACRELEIEMGLERVRNHRDSEDRTQAPLRKEFEQARRLKTDLRSIREGIRTAWDASDDAKSFVAALGDQNLILARGDRRDFVVVDARGGEHALGKRICGVTAGKVSERLGGRAFRDSLLSVDEAKAQQRERQRDGGEDDRRSGSAAARTENEQQSQPYVATIDAGLVAQQREAMRLIKRHGAHQASAVQREIIVMEQGGPMSLTAFAEKHLASLPPERSFDPAAFARSPEAREEWLRHQVSPRARDAAVGRIAEDIAAGKSLDADDVRRLARDDLGRIVKDGDRHLRNLVRAHEERERARVKDRDR